MDFLKKGITSQRYGLSSERKNKLKIWTILEKEEQVDTMNPPQTKGEQFHNMNPPEKWRVMMRLTSMMDDSDDDKVLHSLVDVVSSLEYSKYNTLFMRVVLTS